MVFHGGIQIPSGASLEPPKEDDLFEIIRTYGADYKEKFPGFIPLLIKGHYVRLVSIEEIQEL